MLSAVHPSTSAILECRSEIVSVTDRLRLVCTPEEHPFLSDIVEVSRTALKLPSLPAEFRRIRAVLDDPEASAHDLADAIRGNPLLCARIIAASRSAYFGARRPIEIVDEAVVQLGLRTAATLLFTLLSHSMFITTGASHQEAREIFRHSVAVAFTARRIATLLAPSFAVDAHLAGLLHEAGRIVILALVDRAKPPPSDSLVDRAGDAAHPYFSGILAAQWNMSESLIAAVATDLRRPLKTSPKRAPLLHTLWWANALSSQAPEPSRSLEAARDALGLDESLDRAVELAREDLEAFVQMLG